MQDAGTDDQQHAEEFALLAPPKKLIEKLNDLSDAQRAHDLIKINEIEQEIREMARPGLYEGYPDESLRPVLCSVFDVKRANKGANTHSFQVCYLKVMEGDPKKVYFMDLIDFLCPLWRTTNTLDRVHRGPKFWPKR